MKSSLTFLSEDFSFCTQAELQKNELDKSTLKYNLLFL